MKKFLKLLFGFLLTITCMGFSENLHAKSSKKNYTKKAPYAGFGEKSPVNGLPKIKITSGHIKKTSKGSTFVNPYARSK